jgi:hypothetical protein
MGGRVMRKPLPARRPSITTATQWQGHEITVTTSFYPDTGLAGEVFADTTKGGQIADCLADAAVLASIALQHGVAPDDLTRSLGQVPNLLYRPDDPDSLHPKFLPASPVGAVMDIVKRGAE